MEFEAAPTKFDAMTICPICKSAAEAIGTDYSEGTTFRCQKHGEFDVAETVLDTPIFMKARMDDWEAALKTASHQAIEGKRPRIVTYDFHERLAYSPRKDVPHGPRKA